jgi:hypothetical protein
MKLSHYSQVPLVPGRLLPFDRLDPYPINGMKPQGLWVSVDGEDDWASWCQSEQFGLHRYKFQQHVTLRSMVRHFGKLYAMKYNPRDARMSAYMALNAVDWGRVMKDYQGIIIAPYQWSLRLGQDMLWYYTWDCASGCIWDLDVIEGISDPVAINWQVNNNVDADE